MEIWIPVCVKYIEKYLALIDSKCQEMQQTRPDLSSDKSGYIQIWFKHRPMI